MTKKLKIGVVGASPSGSWGTFAHLPAIAALDKIEVSAVSTAHLETAQETAQKFGISNAFGDARALAEHRDVDVVSVAVRVPAHEEIVSIALAAGKHVYCEWPLGQTTSEAKSLHELAANSGSAHMVGFQARQSPAILYALDIIASGMIGDVVSASLTHSIPWQFPQNAPSSYLLDRDSGAHFLSIPGGHSLDIISFMLGEFKDVTADLSRIQTDCADISRPSCDQASISGTLKNGAHASVRLMGASGIGTGMRYEISGTKGDLILETVPGGRGIQMSDLTVSRTTVLGIVERMEIPEDYFGIPNKIRTGPPANVAKAYLALKAALDAGNAPSPNFADAVNRHLLLDAVQKSSDLGARIQLDAT